MQIPPDSQHNFKVHIPNFCNCSLFCVIHFLVCLINTIQYGGHYIRGWAVHYCHSLLFAASGKSVLEIGAATGLVCLFWNAKNMWRCSVVQAHALLLHVYEVCQILAVQVALYLQTHPIKILAFHQLRKESDTDGYMSFYIARGLPMFFFWFTAVESSIQDLFMSGMDS